MERYLRVNLLGTGPSSYEKRIYRAAVSQRLRNTDVNVPATGRSLPSTGESYSVCVCVCP